ncbi:hypothetical protein FH972_023204 [Carpinus fangiana]|uniref:Protein Zds1 C-terminal domain-containing protein n=1 Tax=Carpinus fangiana TaxID=176857 RepID=A0A5N6KV48_9ROSI|nr:hypothetical protein FH972_023204 [Carpinus fangiana]
MYGESEYDARRSYIANGDDSLYIQAHRSPPTSDSPLSRSPSAARPNGLPPHGRNRQTSNASLERGSPPDLSRSSSTDTATQHFPLNDIDYESSPAAVAQELSNLQAIRRMSMNVDAADPDLPSFGSSFGAPPGSPPTPGGDDESGGLFWVPARLHPELAPKEFKTFVEDRVDLIRRRSGSGESKGLSPDPEGSALNRRRSMLSKTIDSPAEFQDGADLLERKRSSKDASGRSISGETSLSELESLVNDPADLARKMSVDSVRQSLEGGEEGDIPILPQPMGAASLKRSTRTNYRRGSLKRGERVPFSSKRAAGRLSESRTSEDAGLTSPPSTANSQSRPSGRTSTESSLSDTLAHQRTGATSELPTIYSGGSLDDAFAEFGISSSDAQQEQVEAGNQPQNMEQEREDLDQTHAAAPGFHSRFASNGRTTASLPAGYTAPVIVPSIVETPPPPPPQPEARQSLPPSFGSTSSRPERTSSRDYTGQGHQGATGPGSDRLIHHAGTRKRSPNQTLDDMANNPSMMVGNSMSTDALSFIPTFDETNRGKSDKEKKRDRKNSVDSGTGKKSSWGWLLGSDDKSKDKDKGSHDDTVSSSKKSKSKSKLAAIGGKSEKAQQERNNDRAHDNTRLDVLQTTSEGPAPRGRESLVLDRESFKLEDERRKESGRKSTDGKKEPGIFASLFGAKKKGDRESTGKKGHSPLRGLSPTPAEAKILRPDIDYNWTRFSILEERAIYRMAHIKLANPRRALYSQVLLSNFMYSYLAKVQQMHPQIQIPQFIQQKNSKRQQDSEQPTKEQQQQAAEYSAWQQYQEQHEQTGERIEESSSDFIDDSDATYQHQEDARAAQYDASSGYGQQGQQQQWDERNHFNYDNRSQQQAGGEMW